MDQRLKLKNKVAIVTGGGSGIGRAARYTGGVWVGKFLKTVTYQKMTRQASIEIGKITERQCIAEHMLAHGITAKMRVDKYSKN